MADDFVASFTSLTDKGERLQALQSLVQVLTLEERNAARAAISRRNDIITVLPFELALAAFEHLDPLDVWRLRSVSKRWHARLSSTKFVDSAISRWNTHDPSDAALASIMATSRTQEDSIRHIQAVQNGRPTSFKQLIVPAGVCFVRFKGQHLAYTLLKDSCVVILHNICTGCVETYRDEAREGVDDVILTSALFAFRARDFLYWKRLNESKDSIQKVRLTSAFHGLAAGDGELIAMLAWNQPFGTAFGTSLEIFTFDANTLQLEKQIMLLDNELRSSRRMEGSLLVNAAKRSADFFYVRQESSAKVDARIQHVRISLDGLILQHHAVQIPHWPSLNHFQPPQSTGLKGLYAIFFRPNRRSPGVRMLFDADRGTLINATDLTSVFPAPKATCAFWKGSVFSAAKAQASPDDCEMRSFGRTVTIDPAFGHKLYGRYKRSSVQTFNTTEQLQAEIDLHMNDTFLVICEPRCEMTDVFNVFCFDEDVQMHGGQSTYLWD